MYWKRSEGMVCTMLVPKGTSQISNNCPFHTCQISISLSSLWQLWRAAAPLSAEDQQELWSQQRLCEIPGERGNGAGALLPQRWLRTHCKAPAPTSCIGYQCLQRTCIWTNQVLESLLWYLGSKFLYESVSCSLFLQDTEQGVDIEILMGGVIPCLC